MVYYDGYGLSKVMSLIAGHCNIDASTTSYLRGEITRKSLPFILVMVMY